MRVATEDLARSSSPETLLSQSHITVTGTAQSAKRSRPSSASALGLTLNTQSLAPPPRQKHGQPNTIPGPSLVRSVKTSSIISQPISSLGAAAASTSTSKERTSVTGHATTSLKGKEKARYRHFEGFSSSSDEERLPTNPRKSDRIVDKILENKGI